MFALAHFAKACVFARFSLGAGSPVYEGTSIDGFVASRPPPPFPPRLEFARRALWSRRLQSRVAERCSFNCLVNVGELGDERTPLGWKVQQPDKLASAVSEAARVEIRRNRYGGAKRGQEPERAPLQMSIVDASFS